MLLELAVGDAYGACFEYAPANFVARHNVLQGYPEHPRHLGLRPGDYTDDTQLSLAIGELLLSGAEWTHLAVADKLLEVFRRDPRVGYSRRMLGILSTVTSGSELLQRCAEFASTGSGAAMRSAPLGLIPDPVQILSFARIQAAVTHNTAEGVESAQSVALAVHYSLHHVGPIADIAGWVADAIKSPEYATPWRGKVGALGTMSSRAALTAVSRSGSMSELLRTCVAYTGDVDTVAAIALAVGSCSTELAQDLPAPLLAGLENGRYGRDYIVAVDEELIHISA